jgi:hypothetical protein
VKPSPTSGATRGFTWGALFALLWALANIVHLINMTAGQLSAVGWTNLAASLWLLACPHSATRLVALAATQLLDTAVRLPFAPDHQILAATVNVVVITVYLHRRVDNSTDLMTRVAPYARVILLVAYFAAASAKYNTTFLTPANSCASMLAEAASFGTIERDGPLAVAAVGMTLGCETAVFLGLLVRRTRKWAVILGCASHFLLSASPAIAVPDFTVTLWCLLVLFLPAEDLEELKRRLRAMFRRSGFVRDTMRLPGATFLLAIPAVAALAQLSSGVGLLLGNWLVTLATGLALIAALVKTVTTSRVPAPPLGPLRAGQVVTLICLLAIASTPYLGLGTSSRFTMFSSLRTEGPGTNHLFWPSLHLVDSQDDWYIVESMTGKPHGRPIAATERTTEARAAVPAVQVRHMLSHRDSGATLRTQDGATVRVIPGEDHELRGGVSWWEGKTQHYRPFVVEGITDPGFCSN